VEWQGPIQYRLSKDAKYEIGFLTDISTTGAMLWLKKDVPAGASLEVVMKSEFDQKPVHMHMKVKRAVDEMRHDYRGYGCTLQTQLAWEDQ